MEEAGKPEKRKRTCVDCGKHQKAERIPITGSNRIQHSFAAGKSTIL